MTADGAVEENWVSTGDWDLYTSVQYWTCVEAEITSCLMKVGPSAEPAGWFRRYWKVLRSSGSYVVDVWLVFDRCVFLEAVESLYCLA